jgi:hypothetical protein
VFQLPGTASAQAAPVRPVRPGVLTIWVAGPGQPRTFVLADLVARVAERHHLRASVAWQAPGDWAALNVHPADVMAGPPESLDVVVGPANSPGSPAYVVRPGEVRPADPDLTTLDPLALRLALLQHPYRADADLGPDDLKAADEALRHWRSLVAHYALSPSKPMCAQYTGDFLSALDDDLDTPAALRTLSALAGDQVIPDGSKFEAFAYADRFLGLDLVREVGR